MTTALRRRTEPERARRERRLTAGRPRRITPELIERRVQALIERQERERRAWLAGGPRRLREFLDAPDPLQEDFMRRLKAQVEAEVCLDPLGEEEPVRVPAQRPLVWDRTWAKRAERARRPRRPGERDLDAEIAELNAIPPSHYWPLLTGHEGRYGAVRCPLPEHADSDPSAVLSDKGWYCHVCGRGGGIYQLAAALWGLGTRGRDFREVHDRLWEEVTG